ncbi:D-glycero-alpha-D-manno-heptose-1,7-bisphosphate 7-phosphatase [Labilibacter marinus]|uniref:D-glycero-alpha-D-manno-heptose-1,7-bisphosphate 7-phosphatase n=1 Tax=Labilibacter marinus TaxID=1477105 RepID=UPI00094FD6CE|nr:HAD family hydrolase [Labilibacter marinus]
MNKAVFIDRDGVVNSDEGHYYVFRRADFIFNPDIEKSILLLKDAGFKIILITNQGGVAKGEYTTKDVEGLHEYMQFHLKAKGAEFDAIYYCPHHDSVSDCDCRKPKPGMLLKAFDEVCIDANQSYLIGDAQRDVDAGKAAGLKACFKVDKNTSIYRIVSEIISLSE